MTRVPSSKVRVSFKVRVCSRSDTHLEAGKVQKVSHSGPQTQLYILLSLLRSTTKVGEAAGAVDLKRPVNLDIGGNDA